MKQFITILAALVVSVIFMQPLQAQTISTYLTSTDGLNNPSGLAFDPLGNMYIANYGNSKILKVTPTGTVTVLATLSSAPLSMVYYNGFLYTISGGQNIIKVDIVTGTSTNFATNTNAPLGLSVDKNTGTFYASNNGIIYKISTTGVVSTFANNGLGAIYATAIDDNSNVYVADVTNNSIYKYTSTGIKSTFTTNIGGARNMVINAANNLFYLGSTDGLLVKVNSTGTTKSTLANITRDNSYGLALDSLGNIYTSNFSFNTIVKISNVSLPLTLISFSAQTQKNIVALNWQTANEINVAHFVIQRSADDTSFSNIGQVATKGGGNYTYTDDLLSITNQTPKIYYRLQNVDKDGSFTYSKAVAVSLAGHQGVLNIFPNPVQATLFAQITSIKAQTVALVVTDMLGHILQQQTANLTIGNTALSINTTNLQKGTYVLSIKGLAEKQFIKQ